jgi:S-formylglutathione hydrolase FrmB
LLVLTLLILLLSVCVPLRISDASGRTATGPTSVDCGSVPSAILGNLVDYCVALPADYASSDKQYPTLYYLHGLFEDEHRWEERDGKEVLDNLLATGQLGPFLVVLPNGGKTFYINSYDGKERYEDFFIKEFIPAIDHKYRTVAERRGRAIGGTSMGGYGALHLGMRHADLFGSASAQSAALLPKLPDPLPADGRWGFYARVLQEPFGSPLNAAYFEANNPITLAEHPEQFKGLKLYFDCGDHDRYGFEEGNLVLDRILKQKGFPHEFMLRAGDHGWSYLGQYMQYPLLFHWRVFSAFESQ